MTNSDLAKRLIRRQKGKRFITLWLIINATIWVYMTYALAFMDKYNIAETLSTNIVTVILGVFATFAVSNTIENIFKRNDLSSIFGKNKPSTTNTTNTTSTDNTDTSSQDGYSI